MKQNERLIDKVRRPDFCLFLNLQLDNKLKVKLFLPKMYFSSNCVALDQYTKKDAKNGHDNKYQWEQDTIN